MEVYGCRDERQNRELDEKDVVEDERDIVVPCLETLGDDVGNAVVDEGEDGQGDDWRETHAEQCVAAVINWDS